MICKRISSLRRTSPSGSMQSVSNPWPIELMLTARSHHRHLAQANQRREGKQCVLCLFGAIAQGAWNVDVPFGAGVIGRIASETAGLTLPPNWDQRFWSAPNPTTPCMGNPVKRWFNLWFLVGWLTIPNPRSSFLTMPQGFHPLIFMSLFWPKVKDFIFLRRRNRGVMAS